MSDWRSLPYKERIHHPEYRKAAMELQEWNEKLYGTREEKLEQYKKNLPSEGGDSNWFNSIGIDSWPNQKNACASHIPAAWKDDVKLMVENIRAKFGDDVKFSQIKEKFVELTVYFDAPEGIKEEVYGEIRACRERLREKEVHPPVNWQEWQT